MADKFIPERDLDFARMARNFAVNIAREPERFGASAQEAQSLRQAVDEFRDALCAAMRKQTRSALIVSQKNQARASAVRLIRSLAKRIRANDSISAIDKVAIGMRQRPARLKRARRCCSIAGAPVGHNRLAASMSWSFTSKSAKGRAPSRRARCGLSCTLS